MASGLNTALQRISFRQLLFVAFFVTAGLLGAASLRGVSTLEDLMSQSRDVSSRALEVSSAAQSLAERSVSMERAARQSVVLDDRALKQRFNEAANDAGKVVDRLADNELKPETAKRWHVQMNEIASLLFGSAESATDRDRQLALNFRELDAMNANIAQEVQQATQNRNNALLGKLESGRLRLTQQVTGAMALAAVVALGFGVWLTRPLKQMERAIVGLGENRLDETININGPADLQLVGMRLDWLRLRLVELDADKSRFLRHVSHELKTPLASLREGVSLLEDGVVGELSDTQREVVRILRHNTVVLQGQIEDLLRFNAAAFEARQLKREKADLLQIVEDQVSAQRLQWQARELKVLIEGKPQEAEIDIDKIGTAIANLLSNAIRFSPLGGTIRIMIGNDPGLARIDIVDEGRGIEEADRERVFEPFYRGVNQPEDSIRGSGIGLSIVHEYVSAHGGRTVLLPKDSGTHFRIEIPNAFKN